METRERDIERLMPIQAIKIRDNNNTGFSNSSSESVSPLVSSSHHSAGREVCSLISLFFFFHLFIFLLFCISWYSVRHAFEGFMI